MGFVLITIFGLYALSLVSASLFWLFMSNKRYSETQNSVSVLIPFRNEEQNIENLVRVLAELRNAEFEVIFINDHSTDNSADILSKALEKASFHYRMLHLQDAVGKKAAITMGVEASKGDIIVTTDADCMFGESWLRQMIQPFADNRVQMVSGPVQLTGKGLFQRWQKMEFATLIALGAVSIKRGTPTMANGANLAYRKSAFENVGGFEGVNQLPSGDDEFLLMKTHRAFPKGVTFMKSQAAMVSTPAAASWSDLKNQRLRWASKWRLGNRPGTKVTALFVFLINACLILLPLFAALDWISSDVAVFAYRLRFVTEALWMMVLAGFFKEALSVRAFLLHQFLYPFYVVYFGLMANFGNYQWKGRSYPVQVQ